MRLLLLLLIVMSSNVINPQEGYSIGPSGRPLSVCATPDYILLGTLKSGILKSTDDGFSWNYLEGMPPQTQSTYASNCISDMARDPYDPQIIYVGTGPDETTGGCGFFKSTDGGESWNRYNTGLPQFPAVIKVKVNPFNNNEVYLFTRSGQRGIYKSTDKGESWSLFYHENYIGSNLVFDMNDSTRQYAAGLDGTLHIWNNNVHSSLPSQNSFPPARYPLNVFHNPKTNSIIFVHSTGIVKWADSLWKSIYPQGIYITAAVFEKEHGTIFLSTDNSVLKTTDDGETWTTIGNWQDMNIAVDSNRVVMSGFSGVYVSEDYGNEFTRTADAPYTSTLHNASIVKGDSGNVIYVTGSTTGIYFRYILKSTDEGKVWTKSFLPNSSMPNFIKANPENPDIIYAGSGGLYETNPGLYKSYNGGISWTKILNKAVTSLDISPADTSLIFAGSIGSVYKSTNSGYTWGAVLTADFTTTNSVVISRQTPGMLYIGTSANNTTHNGFYLSTDNGESWTRRVNGFGTYSQNIGAVGIDPSDDKIIFAANNLSIYKTTNRGYEWKSCFFDISNFGTIKDIKPAPGNPDWVFTSVQGQFVGWGGLFYSTDKGVTWEEILLPDTSDKAITFLELQHVGDTARLYAGTHSYGCFVLDLKINTILSAGEEIIPGTISVSQNYPNPFNSETVIRYIIPSEQRVRIAVYNTLGEEVQILTDREVSAGSYSIPWNASGLTSGVYFCRVTAGTHTETKKMILMK